MAGGDEMGAWFGVVFRMSLTASLVIAAVFLIRILLIRAPRRYSYLLWLIVLFRLLCPAAVETRIGLIPNMEKRIGENQAEERQVTENQSRYRGMTPADMGISEELSEDRGAATNIDGTAVKPDMPVVSGDDEWEARSKSEEAADAVDAPEKVGFWLGTWGISEAAGNIIGGCWLCGCLILLGWGIWGYLRLLYRLRGNEKSSFSMEDSIHAAGKKIRFSVWKRRCRYIRVTEDAGTRVPFTLGVVRPVICLPEKLLPFQREMVLAHEAVHISRQDNFVKLIAYAARCIHWFNPLVWIAFRYFEEDMEVSCDEAVLRCLGYGRRRDYAKTLLALSTSKTGSAGFYPVSFGRKNTKARIRNVLSVKKANWRAAFASAVLVAAAAVLLLADHKPDSESVNTDGKRGNMAEGALAGEEPGNAAQAIFAQQEMISREIEQARRIEEERQRESYEAMIRWNEDLVHQQEAIRELEERIENERRQLEEMAAAAPDQDDAAAPDQNDAAAAYLLAAAQRIQGGTVDEGEIRLQDSESFLQYANETDGAVTEINADTACALLCNPITGLDESGSMIIYAFPIAETTICSSDYGCRLHPVQKSMFFHSGMDFAAQKGTPVLAAADGCVYRTGMDSENGNYVILIHQNGECTYYAHCDSVSVEAGDVVACGQQIAVVGNTGKSTGAHLHFAVSRQGAFIRPRLLESRADGPEGSETAD